LRVGVVLQIGLLALTLEDVELLLGVRDLLMLIGKALTPGLLGVGIFFRGLVLGRSGLGFVQLCFVRIGTALPGRGSGSRLLGGLDVVVGENLLWFWRDFLLLAGFASGVSDGIAGGLVLGARGEGAKRERECQRDECSYRTHVGASRAQVRPSIA